MKTIKMMLCGLVLVLTLAPVSASAAPAGTGARAAAICDTGYRGMPEYDRRCLRTGTPRDAYGMWVSMSKENRRYVCRNAKRMGIMAAARDFYFDGTFDTFRNHERVLFWLGLFSRVDCRSMGYRV